MNTKTQNVAKESLFRTHRALIGWVVTAAVASLAVGAAIFFREQWLPRVQAAWLKSTGGREADDPHGASDNHDHDHGDGKDDHDHEGHDEVNSLELSEQATKTIGLTTGPIELKSFTRSITIPAMVVPRSGRTEIDVTAPLGGRVTRVYAVEGEAVMPGQPLFDLRLTHEELVQAQSAFLRTAEELDVVAREIHRLRSVAVPGAIAGKTVREREYEQQKLKAVFNAQRQSLLLHGLTTEQIDMILRDRKLVQGVTVVAPPLPQNGDDAKPEHPCTIRDLEVKPGQYVDAGKSLCRLMDFAELYLEGQAFERDIDDILNAAKGGWPLTAIREASSGQRDIIEGLHIVFVDNEVDPESRALYFYVSLPNQIVLRNQTRDGHRFVTWRFRTGQRMQVRVPVEVWEQRIVLPVDAVARDGVEFYVFRQNGHHFDRVPVTVEYRDQYWVVIANDGSVFPGDIVATSAAHQLQMALKNKSGGAPDPHAGHNH